jgi:PAS domain S-box-containing protein
VSRHARLLLVACGILAALAAVWHWSTRPPRWSGPIRVGFRDAPPFYFVEPGGRPLGMAVDVMNAAANRLGLTLQWVQIAEPSDAALRAGRIDLWPTLPVAAAAAPLAVTEPWLESDFFLVCLRGTGIGAPDDTAGRVVTFYDRPDRLEARLAETFLPRARLLGSPTILDRLQRVCRGEAAAAFMGGREAFALLLLRPPGCEQAVFRFSPVPGATLQHGIGSMPAAAGVAAGLRAEIEDMGRDGTLPGIHAEWSFTTANEVRIVYALEQARLRNRLSAAGVALLALALVAALWQVSRSRQARRLAEASARQQERYRVLFERNLAGVYRTTTDGRILDCNDAFARMLGCASREDLLTRQAWEFYPDPKVREATLDRLRHERTVTNNEVTVRRADGKTAVLLESATLIEQRGGQPAIIEGTLVDITRERELEDRYRQAQKLESIGRLAGGVAHDFNNTLTAINGYSELVLSGLSESDPNYAMMLEIQRAGRHAESLTRQLLAFSRRQHLQPKVINLNRTVTETLDLLRRVIGEDIALVTSLSPDLGNVRADPGQIQQVLMNLAVNARDAMPDGGQLTIATANVQLEAQTDGEPGLAPGAYVRLSMADSGCGMDEETQRQVFEPYFTTKERGKGTGLGLSMVYGIVKQSGGDIRFRSSPGTGSTFEIDLPRVGEAPVEGERSPQRADLRGSETVLVVEDQDDVRRLVVAALTRYGYRVLSANQGDTAVDLCRREPGPIHLLLADVVMPGATGPAVAAACQALRPDLRVLYMSGYTDNVLRPGTGPDGPGAYLQKPFTPLQLAEKVREVLGAG